MNNKPLLWIIIGTLLVVSIHAQWESTESIQSLQPFQIISDPENARSHWSSLSADQKDQIYRDSRGIVEFSDKFASENQLSSLTLDQGSARYDGTHLINGDVRLPVSALTRAKVRSLLNGGFSVTFPEGTDLSAVDLDGGFSGLEIMGTDITFSDGILEQGSITFYGDRLDLATGSVYRTPTMRITPAEPLSLYSRTPYKEDKGIFVSSTTLSVLGDVSLEFLESPSYAQITVEGTIDFHFEGATLSYDGQGNSYSSLPIHPVFAQAHIRDKNAPETVIQGFGEGYEVGDCFVGRSTGQVANSLTGLVSICRGNLVRLGSHRRDSFWGGFDYTAELNVNQEQAQHVYQKAVSLQGGSFNFDEDDHVESLGHLITQEVDDLQLVITSHKAPSVTKESISRVLSGWLSDAGITQLTSNEQQELDVVYDAIAAIDPTHLSTTTYEVSGQQGQVIVATKDGKETSYPVSGRVSKAIMANYYDDNINSVDGQARALLEALPGIGKLVQK